MTLELDYRSFYCVDRLRDLSSTIDLMEEGGADLDQKSSERSSVTKEIHSPQKQGQWSDTWLPDLLFEKRDLKIKDKVQHDTVHGMMVGGCRTYYVTFSNNTFADGIFLFLLLYWYCTVD